MNIRSGNDDDGDALAALIGACWSEYPGCVMDAAENAHLRAPATHYARLGGRLTVAEDEAGRVVGCISSVGADKGELELKGLYVDAAHRGSGLAVELLRIVEKEALERNAPRLILWSDTRFTRAHRFYERHGFVAAGAIRALNDLSRSIEYPYAKPMRPRAVECLDAAASRSALRPLAALVAGEPFWTATAGAVANGSNLLFAAWYAGALSGALVLDLPQSPNECHRADLRLLHVAAGARRIGVATQLLATAERTAASRDRLLLTAMTETGGPGDRFLDISNFNRAGLIPGYTRVQGAPVDMTLFWRPLGETP